MLAASTEQRASAWPPAFLRPRARLALLHLIRTGASRHRDSAEAAPGGLAGPVLHQPRPSVLMQLKPFLSRSLRWLGFALLLLAMLLVSAFGVLRTSIGLGWAGNLLAGLMSSPGFSVTLHELEGSVPFDMRARRLEISDDRGTWLALNDAHLDLAAGELLAGGLHVKALTVGEIVITRFPEAAVPPEPIPLSERLRLPRPLVAVAIDRLAIERLALDTDTPGESVEAAIAGRAILRGGTADVMLDLHRTDGMPRNRALELHKSGVEPVMAVRG